MPTEKPRPERPADLREKARNDLLYLARTERSMGNKLLASRVEEAVESLDAFRSFAIHQAEQIARLVAEREELSRWAQARLCAAREAAERERNMPGGPAHRGAAQAWDSIAAALDPPTGEDDRSVHGDLRPGFTFRELEGAMDAVAEGARREFLRGVGTTELRNALGKADDWGEVGLADLFAGELQRRGAGR